MFGNMTVIENILVGMFTRLRQTAIGVLFRTQAFNNEEFGAHDKAFQLMDFVGISGLGDELARNLPYGV